MIGGAHIHRVYVTAVARWSGKESDRFQAKQLKFSDLTEAQEEINTRDQVPLDHM